MWQHVRREDVRNFSHCCPHTTERCCENKEFPGMIYTPLWRWKKRHHHEGNVKGWHEDGFSHRCHLSQQRGISGPAPTCWQPFLKGNSVQCPPVKTTQLRNIFIPNWVAHDIKVITKIRFISLLFCVQVPFIRRWVILARTLLLLLMRLSSSPLPLPAWGENIREVLCLHLQTFQRQARQRGCRTCEWTWVVRPFLKIVLDSKFLSLCTSAKVKASRARELSKQRLQEM